MNLVGYTTTALSRNDIIDTPTNKNVVDGAIVELKDYDGNLVTIYDDINGTNPETQKTCDTNGQCTFFAEAGDYVLEVNGRPQNITISVNITVVNDVSSQRIWGDRYKGELTADVGVTLTDEFSVLLYNGNYYSYIGSDPFPVIVASGTVPAAPDYKLRNPTDHDSDINRNAAGAHDDIYTRNFKSVTDLRNQIDATGSLIDLSVLSGNKVYWRGYYQESDGGENWGIVKTGDSTTLTDDGGSIFIVVNDAVNGVWVEALSNNEGDIKRYGAANGLDNTLAIQNCVNNHSVINLSNVKGVLSDSIKIDKPVIVYGHGLDESIHERAYVDASSNTHGVNITSIAAANSQFRDFQIKFTGVLSGDSDEVYIGINNTLADNITTERCRFDGGNVGVHYKQVNGGVIQYNQIENMVLANNGVTGYGINTDGADGVLTFKNTISQCERHSIYVGRSNVLISPKNQRHLYNDISWSGTASPSTQQAAIKVFGAENITCIGNTGSGLKKAYWFSDDIDGFHAQGNTWNDMSVRGCDDENIPNGKILKNINISDEFINCVTGIQTTNSNTVWEDLNANGSKFKGMTTGLQPTYVNRWSYSYCTFEDLANGIFTAPNVTSPPTGHEGARFVNCTNNITNSPTGGNSNLSGSSTPDVSDNYDDYYVANSSAISVTNFTGGFHGQLLTILVIQSSGTTTFTVGSGISSKDGNNIVPLGNSSIVTFKNIRGNWREV